MSAIVDYAKTWALTDVLLLLFSIVFVLHWVAYIYGQGRYSNSHKDSQNSSAGYLIATLFAKVITNFRHLLALIIVSIFGIAVLYSMLDGKTFGDNLQTVVAALGGIVGSVIGYYFGEAKLKANDNDDSVDPLHSVDQGDPPDDSDPGLRAPPVPHADPDPDDSGAEVATGAPGNNEPEGEKDGGDQR
jgi:hypothetical protein